MPKPRTVDSSITVAEALRFWALVDKHAAGGHWLWTGFIDKYANPQFAFRGRRRSARRMAWDLEHPDHDPLTPGVKLYPTCDRRDCVNPAHMQVRIGGGNMPRDICGRGHAMTDDNIYLTSQGKRACRKCITITSHNRRERYLKEGRGWGSSYRPLAKHG